MAEIVRRHDPDRFLCALFAPPARREALFTLFAFNHELARARDAVSQPPLALIRLHWWREVVEGTARRHEVATPLQALIGQGVLDPGALLPMIAAREAEADPAIATLADWREYLLGTAGQLSAAAGDVLGAPPAMRDGLRALGAAYGVAGVLRSARALAAGDRCLLPEDVLARHGLMVEDAIHNPDDPRLRLMRAELAEVGLAFLRHGRARCRGLPRTARAAALPAVLAARDLARPDAPARPRLLGDRLAVAVGSLFGLRAAEPG